MKRVLLMTIICSFMFVSRAQDGGNKNDSLNREVTRQECPAELVQYINDDLLKTRAVLLVFNESLHPLGRYEFYDAGAMVRYMHIPMRMNRCTLIYVDTGLHLFHTIYQQLKEPVYFGTGKIYLARLFSRPIWPIGGVSVIKKNDKGQQEEYAAMLFEYINSVKATELLNKMKKREVLVNE